MADAQIQTLITALRARDVAGVKAAVKANPKAARQGRAVVQAAGLAFIEGLAVLVEHGADLNAVYRGYRPLHNLIQSDPHEGEEEASAEVTIEARLACLDWMLEHGADPEQAGAWPPGRAVVIAAFGGQKEFVERFHRKGDAFAACALGDRKTVEGALRKHPDFAKERDTGGLTALQCAAGSRMAAKVEARVAIAEMLLDAGAELAAKTKSWSHEIDAVYLAANAKGVAMFRFLLERGADPHAALTSALWNGTEEMAGIALLQGASPDEAKAGGQPLLNNLIRWGSFDKALWLLRHGASPNLPDERGWTAMHQAASRGNERMVRALLDAGGDPAVRDAEGCLPRDRATRDPILLLLARQGRA